MILHLAIGQGDIDAYEFTTSAELIEYLQHLKAFDCIWLATLEGESEEILITESVDLMCKCVENGFFDINFNTPNNFFVQEYESFESAYAVALDMREGHPKHWDIK